MRRKDAQRRTLLVVIVTIVRNVHGCASFCPWFVSNVYDRSSVTTVAVLFPLAWPMDDLERLFRTYHAPLVRYLTRRLGDRDQAEEIAQETFVRAMKHGPVSSERSWLFAVATNLVRDEARRDARQRRHLELLRVEQSQQDMTPEPTRAEQLREAALARRAVNALGERDRIALLMKEEGLNYPEIAAALDIAVSSVGTTLSRARRRLVDVYEGIQQERLAAGSGGAGSHA